jgi:hypothetical protein
VVRVRGGGGSEIKRREVMGSIPSRGSTVPCARSLYAERGAVNAGPTGREKVYGGTGLRCDRMGRARQVVAER